MNLREIGEKIEIFALDVIHRRRVDSLARVCSVLFFGMSRLFRGIVQMRNDLYQRRLLRHRVLGCLVVSIGNITVGGTGKTPVTEIFARTLAAKGRRVAILSRGYRSKSKPLRQKILDTLFRTRHQESPPRVVSEGQGQVLLGSDMAGDEPYMLARNVPNAVVLVDKDRVKAGRYAIRRYGCDTLILDDGFQYRHLKPKINILLVDATNPFSNHHLLPLGLLREPIKNVRRADYIFLTKSDGSPRLRLLKSFLRRHNPRAEIIECTHRPKYLRDLRTGEQLPLEHIRGRKVAAISGIAVPESFEAFLEKLGASIVYRERFADHHRYHEEEISAFLERAREAGADLALTTEKDAVRFPTNGEPDPSILYLRVEIDILSGQENFDQCISRICFS